MKIYTNTFAIILLAHFITLTINSNENTQNQQKMYKQQDNDQITMNDLKKASIIQNNTLNETAPITQFKCPCLNDGKCFTSDINRNDVLNVQNIICQCPVNYLGPLCQQKAIELPVTSDIYQLIRTTKYKYFYYQPSIQNAYSFSFHICFSQTDQELLNTNVTDLDQIQKAITFFFTVQNLNGIIEINETENEPQTIVLQRDECKHIYADYTTFSITKTQQIQKIILAVKLGNKLYDNTNLTVYTNTDGLDKKKNNTLKYQLDSKSIDINSSKLKYQIGSPHANKKYTKQYLQKELNNNTTRLVYIDFNIQPFTLEQVIQNILYSLATIASFVMIAILLFVLRSKILGLSLAEIFNSSHGMENNIKFFDKYMPPESFRQEHTQNTEIIIQDQDDQQQCVICLITLGDGQYVRRTPCDHVFHKQCIDSWCTQNLTCPVCRKSLTQKNLKQLDQPSLLQIRTNSDSND